ncbi:MAG: hypothetical protein Q9208_000606 [Pyrenodesmia sp. 3 TL-2023]
MRSLLLLPILGLSTFLTSTNALPPNLTTPTPPPSLLTPRKWNPLPNPYHVPNSRLTLDFDSTPAGTLNALHTNALLAFAHRHIRQHIQLHGDSPIPLGIRAFRTKSTEMLFASDPQFRVMRYTELLAVVRGFREKMFREGYRARTAVVLYELEDGGGEIETGEVNIERIGDSMATTA